MKKEELINQIDNIKNIYGEPLFKAGLRFLLYIGTHNFKEEIVTKIINNEKDIINNFNINIAKCAFDLSKINIDDILMYISEGNVFYGFTYNIRNK